MPTEYHLSIRILLLLISIYNTSAPAENLVSGGEQDESVQLNADTPLL